MARSQVFLHEVSVSKLGDRKDLATHQSVTSLIALRGIHSSPSGEIPEGDAETHRKALIRRGRNYMKKALPGGLMSRPNYSYYEVRRSICYLVFIAVHP